MPTDPQAGIHSPGQLVPQAAIQPASSQSNGLGDTFSPIYVLFSEDDQHIRKWSRAPFEGGIAFHSIGLAPGSIAALLDEIARIANDYDLREAIVGHPQALADSFIWRDCIELAERLAETPDDPPCYDTERSFVGGDRPFHSTEVTDV